MNENKPTEIIFCGDYRISKNILGFINGIFDYTARF